MQQNISHSLVYQHTSPIGICVVQSCAVLCVLSFVQRFVLCNELSLALPFEEVFEALAHLGIPGDVLEPLASDDLELHRRRPEEHAQTGH